MRIADVIFRIPAAKKSKVLISDIPTSLTELFSQLVDAGRAFLGEK
jgi:hypothetical protein